LILTAVFALTLGIVLSAVGQTIRVGPAAPSSRIGVASRDVTAADVSRDKLPGEFGAYVNDLSAGGPAEKAGIRTGDVIVEFDGVRVRSSAELQRLVLETPVGRSVKVGLVRGGKRMEVAVTTDANPNARDFSFRIPTPESPRVVPPLWREPPTRDWYYFLPPSTRLPFALRPRSLGISLQALTPQLAEYFHTKEGVLVASVDDGSPASRAGVKAGDIITSIDGRAVTRGEDVTSAVRAKRAGEEVALGIVRDGKPLTIKVSVGGMRNGNWTIQK
jgi:serine protease Do